MRHVQDSKGGGGVRSERVELRKAGGATAPRRGRTICQQTNMCGLHTSEMGREPGQESHSFMGRSERKTDVSCATFCTIHIVFSRAFN